MTVLNAKIKSPVARLIAGVASASLLAASIATPAMAQGAPLVITADEFEFEQERLERRERRQFRQAQRLRGGDYIQTPNGDYVLIEDRRFRKGLRAGHRVQDDGYYGRPAHRHIEAPTYVERPLRNNDNRNAAIAAGIVGLAAGAIIANEFARNRNAAQPQIVGTPRYQEPIPIRRIERVPLSQLQGQQRTINYAQGSDGWIGSGDWLRYCTAKYRSFNPNTGRFLSYSGQYKLCR
ncbi:MAG: BA14K family protein [Pseudomonadota bacterium]